MTTIYPAIYVGNGNTSAVFDGTNFINSTFLHLNGTDNNCGVIHIFGSGDGNINISDSVFSNISNSYSSPSAGAVYYNINSSGNGYYNIKGNTFYDISSNKSVLALSGSFTSLLFSYNTFYNVTSKDTEGVFFFFSFFFFIFIFILFYFILLFLFYFFFLI
jgi:hypothetical protein